VWKLADVIALHKKKAKNIPGNYRPISLLAIVSKMLEAIVVAPLSRFLAPLLNSHQFGFRARHTSLDLLTNMTQRWANALNRGDGGEARAIAIDFSKAFDTVCHEALLLKLKRLGVDGKLHDWFRSFLTDRKQRVVVGSAASPYAPVTSGVPQGSVLSPLLFICFINDAFDVVDNHLDVFADDSTLWAEIPSQEHRAAVAASLDKDLAALNTWAERWLMKFNHSKTELLTISRKKDVLAFRQNGLDKEGHYKVGAEQNPHPSLTFGSATLPESACAKVVGLTIASNLSWLPHIQRIGNHANKAVSILHRARNFLSKAALASVYKSHVRSRMEYLSPIWSGALPMSSTLDCLDKIQARAAKLVGPNEAFKFQELAHRRGISGLCFVHRLQHQVAPVSVLDLLPALATAPARASSRLSKRAGGTPFFAKPAGSARLVNSNSWIKSCVPLFVRTFNALPAHIQKLTSLQAFKTAANEAVDLTFHAN
jgi:ribonuclease P/MRP protein subunit RPP40